uniref:Uncharacterized protein n=1 Tax=Caenorhabditis japonica TaxID=281687 RepID=A0A8R1IV39_CAEJA
VCGVKAYQYLRSICPRGTTPHHDSLVVKCCNLGCTHHEISAICA